MHFSQRCREFCVASVGLEKLAHARPLNIMATLLVATLCAWLIEVGGPVRLVAAGALASLYVVNRNLWTLAALPLIFPAGQVDLNVPRGRFGFYMYYPVHLAVIWGLSRML
jgi:hypothetical protein